MVRLFETETLCDCSAEQFWQLRTDLEFDRYLARIEKQTFKLVSLEEATEEGKLVISRTSHIVYEENPIPSSLRGIMGKAPFAFTISGKWHRDLYDEEHGLTFTSTPSVLADRISVAGRQWVESISPTQCKVFV